MSSRRARPTARAQSAELLDGRHRARERRGRTRSRPRLQSSTRRCARRAAEHLEPTRRRRRRTPDAHPSACGAVTRSRLSVVEHWFSIPSIQPEQDMRVAVDQSGTLVAYATSTMGARRAPASSSTCGCRPRRARTSASIRRAPGGQARERAAPGALTRGIFPAQDDAAGVFARGGYELVRHSLRMERSLEDEPAAPEWPAGLSLRTATEDMLRPSGPRSRTVRGPLGVRDEAVRAMAAHWSRAPRPTTPCGSWRWTRRDRRGVSLQSARVGRLRCRVRGVAQRPPALASPGPRARASSCIRSASSASGAASASRSGSTLRTRPVRAALRAGGMHIDRRYDLVDKALD
jgi:hypothetical protein